MDPAQTPPFDSWADVYESLIDWPKRLNHESPFYRRLFERLHASRILDTACGTGQHAARFHQWGFVVEGADVSPAMIAAARQRHGESPQLTWQVRSFASPVPSPAEFDVVLCTGNSLALAENRDTVQQAVHAMISALRPGGCLVLHVLNLWRLPDGPCVWQKCVRTGLNEGNGHPCQGRPPRRHSGLRESPGHSLDRTARATA